MASKNVIDKRSVKLADVMRADYIPFLGGRPARTSVIGSEDMLNLTIALNTTPSVERFIALV